MLSKGLIMIYRILFQHSGLPQVLSTTRREDDALSGCTATQLTRPFLSHSATFGAQHKTGHHAWSTYSSIPVTHQLKVQSVQHSIIRRSSFSISYIVGLGPFAKQE